MASIDLITKADLEQFKAELLTALTALLASQSTASKKQWLRSAEVRKLLNISSGTLQNLRISGQLHCSKVGSIFYYRQEDIQRMLEGKEQR